MTFKQFVSWCNQRAFDGCWSMITAMACIDLIEKIRISDSINVKNIGEKTMKNKSWMK